MAKLMQKSACPLYPCHELALGFGTATPQSRVAKDEEHMPKTLILCDCSASQPLNPEAIAQGDEVVCSKVHTALCTTELSAAAQFLQLGDAVIACGQEQATFEDLAAELGVDAPGFVDLRDRAGWSDEADQAAAKMAALAAEAMLPVPATPSVDVISEGVCFVIGPGEVALRFAQTVAPVLSVTVLVTDDAELSTDRSYDVVRGRVRTVSGALGGFDLTIDGLQMVQPGGRGGFTLSDPRDGGRSRCDLVVDLSGGAGFVTAPQKREGYLRADPRDPLAVSQLAVDAVQLIGTFEKPLYVRFEETLCAHSRAEQVACTNCLDVCPTGAITSAGEHVAIDPMVCAGCGSCAALCPSTAITYEDPPVASLVLRMQVMAATYRDAGGGTPRLLVHDALGGDMIRLSARFGRGLPADVIPLELGVVSGFGHAEMLAALAVGYGHVDVLLPPRAERDALDRELTLARALAGGDHIGLIDTDDPEQLSDLLYAAARPTQERAVVLPMGNRRQVARLSSRALNLETLVPLPEGAPYGAVAVNTDACTLCLSCVSLCPSGALMDNPDMPQLNFQEDACLQCGMCQTICPENAIDLVPQMDLSDAALSQRVLNEEEPCACIECGALFGVKSTVERIMEKLAGSHPMFASSQQARMIQMCDNCRVQAQFHSEDNPFTDKPRPRVVTTEDYYSGRKDH